MHFRSNWTNQDWRITVTSVLSQGSGGKEVSSTETRVGKPGSRQQFRGRLGIIGPMGLVIWISASRWVGEGRSRKAWGQVEEKRTGKWESQVRGVSHGAGGQPCNSVQCWDTEDVSVRRASCSHYTRQHSAVLL